MTHKNPVFQKLLAISFLLFLMFPVSMRGQVRNDIEVTNGNGQALKYPWAGGMNSIQFGEIDLDLNGQKDLVAFDRNGNRKMCFINYGVYQQIDFSYSPQFADLLPELYEWAIFKDYDGDGKTDIFTYSPGWAGMLVYKNVSTDILKFEKVVYPYLKTFQENGYVNLLVTEVDYPGIEDVDFDGDLDILSFWGLGSFVNFHRNMSMEKYGTADSLDFRLEEYCWGNFAESEESNEIFLDSCFVSGEPLRSISDNKRHTGSTFLLLDLNKDTVLDLLLGDVDYPNIFALENSGNKHNANISVVETNFPSSSEKINLFSFPAAAYIDVDNDGKKDLLVSPFDPSLDNATNKKSVLLYKNTGANDKPFFNLESKEFLQSEMIDRGSGAYPVLYDWDGDGLLDLFVGNFGFYKYSYYNEHYLLYSVYRSQLGYFKNTGTLEKPAFQLWDNDFGGLAQLNSTALMPSFIDIDGDDKTDLLVGDSSGFLIYARNIDNDNFEIITQQYENINKGFYSAPQIFDLDKDELNDLVIGEQNGNINFFKNVGSELIPDFEFVTDSLGKINVQDDNISQYGYSVPWFFRPQEGETQLLVGSEQGDIFFYNNIDGNLTGKFTESDNLYQILDTTDISFDRGIRTGATIGNISDDDKLEMIVGNFSGGLEYFNGNAEVLPGILDIRQKASIFQLYPNPADKLTEFNINSTEHNAVLTLYKSTGQTVIKNKNIILINGNYQLDISNIQNGIYIISVRTSQSINTGKLIIQH